MPRNCQGFCTACLRDGLKCNRGKPHCRNCLKRGSKCSYVFELRWGGRRSKGNAKSSAIPNTKLVKGTMVVKDRNMIASRGSQTVKQFLLYDEKCSGDLEIVEKPMGEKVGQISFCLPTENIPKIQDYMIECCNPNPGIPLSGIPNFAELFNEFGENWSEFWTLFTLFVNETSQFFIGLNSQERPNPYRTILPGMALSSPTLLKLLVAFGAKHRKMLGVLEEETMFQSLEDSGHTLMDFESVGENLLRQSLEEVSEKLSQPFDCLDDCTLAIVLLISNLHIFSGEGGGGWRTHYNGAKMVALRLKANDKREGRVIPYKWDPHPHFFVLRWFIYLAVIGCLSSARFSYGFEETNTLEFDFGFEKDFSWDENMMKNFEDINPFNGMDHAVLAYLTEVSQLIMQKKYYESSRKYELIDEAIKLDYKILNYLKTSEHRRDQLLQSHILHNESPHNSRIQNYDLLRNTNLIIGLTGVLQLRRRVVELSQDSELVKELVLRITNLIILRIPLHSSALCSILFCLFTVGCELVDDRMIDYRKGYLDRLDALWRKGFKNASQAAKIMKESWRLKKAWWILLEERNLDICLAL
ncbi:hypothetical protein BZL39_C08760 [Zygosaccharomyces parabailii]|nr:hypothetical protein BZL39_C08760 [Zygosaccharomyces parabailii]CDH15763.1 uncharacterized protein ZBAI_07550 [Zygosaccharomyces bailii ISA1307]